MLALQVHAAEAPAARFPHRHMGFGVARDWRRGDIVEVRRRGIHNETGIGNVFVAETVGELVADFGRGAVAVGAGQGELQIFLGCFVRRICADGASRQHCQHGDGHQQPAELAHQRFLPWHVGILWSYRVFLLCGRSASGPIRG